MKLCLDEAIRELFKLKLKDEGSKDIDDIVQKSKKFKIECIMMSMPKKDNSKQESKIGLGAKTNSGYKYSSRINFKEDLSIQIAKAMQEKKQKMS